MPLDPTLGELSDQQSMTHEPEQPGPLKSFFDYARQPAPPRAPEPWEEKINQAIIKQDPRYVPAQSPQQQNWQRWAEEALGLPFGFIGSLKWTTSEIATLQRMMESGQFSASQLPGRTPISIARKMEDLASQPIERARQKGAPVISGNQEKIDQLMQMMSSQNITVYQMAEKLGVSEKSLRRYLSDELNVRIRKAFGSDWDNPQRIKQYKEMIAEGWSQEQMAKKLGTHVGTVGRQLAILNRAGIVDYTPMGGARTPSLPSFNFPEEAAGDPEYERALTQFLQGQQALPEVNVPTLEELSTKGKR